VICLQELFRSLYFCQEENHDWFRMAESIPGPSTEALGNAARQHGMVIIGSLFERRAAGIYHNTAVVLDADGSLAGIYRKMHIPDDPLYYEKFYFTPGDLGFRTFPTKFGKLGTLVCWDQWYPEAARLTALQGAEILFYPTAIQAGHQHRLPFLYAEGDVDVLRLALHGGIDRRVGKPAAAVEDVQADHVAPELIFVEEPLLAETEPAHEEATGEPAGVGGADGRGEHLVGDGLVAREGETADHALGLLGLERRRQQERREQRADARDGRSHLSSRWN
jgi:hypothetical protein